jgi:hypothetical protein
MMNGWRFRRALSVYTSAGLDALLLLMVKLMLLLTMKLTDQLTLKQGQSVRTTLTNSLSIR